MLFFRLILLLSLFALITASEPSARAGPADNTQRTASLDKAETDALYGRLATTNDPEEAKGILRRIMRLRNMSGSATADLLLERSEKLAHDGELSLALELIEKVQKLTPLWSEGWYRRAALFQKKGETSQVLAALVITLSLEPRHIEALQMLADYYTTNKDSKNALLTYRRLRELYPSSQEFEAAVKAISNQSETGSR